MELIWTLQVDNLIFKKITDLLVGRQPTRAKGPSQIQRSESRELTNRCSTPTTKTTTTSTTWWWKRRSHPAPHRLPRRPQPRQLPKPSVRTWNTRPPLPGEFKWIKFMRDDALTEQIFTVHTKHTQRSGAIRWIPVPVPEAPPGISTTRKRKTFWNFWNRSKPTFHGYLRSRAAPSAATSAPP